MHCRAAILLSCRLLILQADHPEKDWRNNIKPDQSLSLSDSNVAGVIEQVIKVRIRAWVWKYMSTSGTECKCM